MNLSRARGDLTRLPFLKPGSVDRVSKTAKNLTPLRCVKEGRRKNTLFRHLKDHAPYCDDREALLDVGMTFDNDCDRFARRRIIKTVIAFGR
jgi:hypothetical protein